jgi:ATP-binding cassette subfamily B protein
MHPKILILDDATSAVDVKTDQKIKRSLKETRNDMTTFIVASRISSVMNADKIIVLEDGKMVGFDTHENLLKNNSYYQEIYHSQLVSVGDDYA